jgi:hypothetical protein
MNKASWEVSADRPAGGFVLIRAELLFAVWWCYERGTIQLADVRMWFALQEVVARRCTIGPRRQTRFTTEELMELTGQRRRGSVKASLRRLEEGGLARSRRSAITFAKSIDEVALRERTAFETRLGLIANHRRRVPVPRRILRWLAASSRRVLIAATLGHLLRLLYLRDGACRADGNCKASWLAATFAINVRSVKQGRKRLMECGLLRAQEMPQWYRNRYGWRGSLNLQWTASDAAPNAKQERREPPLPKASMCIQQPPPRQNRKLSSRDSNQKPASRPLGSCGKERGCLGEITTAELRDDQGTKRLLKRAVTNRLVGPGDRLNVFAAAEHALRVGTRNPAGLFVWLIVNRRWDFVTQGDEDEARRRLLRMERSPTRLPPGRVGELLEAMRFSTCTPPDQANLSGIDAVLQQCLAA